MAFAGFALLVLLVSGLIAAQSAAVVSTSSVHRCIHDSVGVQQMYLRNGVDVVVPQRSAVGVDRRQSSSQSIRIALFTEDLTNSSKFCTSVGGTSPNFQGATALCAQEDIFTTEKRSILLTKILPVALSQLQSALRVVRLSTPLVVSGTACSLAQVPDSVRSTGVADADYVLFVSAGPTPSASVLAFASACAIDQRGRPIAGHANFGPAAIQWGEEGSYGNAQQVATAVHEMMHALGFSPSMFRFFPSASVVSPTTVTSIRGKPAGPMVTTPEVLRVARAYFGCPGLTGVELEDEGGTGSAGSHWEARVLREELMAAADGKSLSVFTLAFFKDSGMYDVDYHVAQPLTYGSGDGCGFVTAKCNEATGGRDRYWCFEARQACTIDRKAAGICNLGQRTNDLEKYFQYFSDPRTGGPEFLDGCPFIQGASNRQCAFFRTPSEQDTFFGHSFSATSRCFDTTNTAGNTGLIQRGFTAQAAAQRCLDARCPSGMRLEVRVGGTSTWLSCPADGSAGTIEPPAGYTGQIICPAASTLCNDDTLLLGTRAPTSSAPTTPSVVTVAGSTSVPSNAPAAPAQASGNGTSTPASTTGAAGATSSTAGAAPTATTTARPPSAIVTVQFVSQLPLGQLTANSLDQLRAALLDATQRSEPSTRLVQLEAFINSRGESVLRVTVTLASAASALSTSRVTGAVEAEVAAPASLTSTLSRPRENSFAVVPDCLLICTTGTIAARRNADNDGCQCVCADQWNGTLCSVCAPRFNADACNRCAQGYAGYPACAPVAQCVQPNASRLSISVSAPCAGAIANDVAQGSMSCRQAFCTCTSGQFEASTQRCVAASASRCGQAACDSELSQCLLSIYASATERTPGKCGNDSAPLAGGRALLRQWCAFDLCMNEDLQRQCTATEANRVCGVAAGASDVVRSVSFPLHIALLAVLASLLTMAGGFLQIG